MLEGVPGPRLPKVDCGDGPTAWLMRREQVQMLWELASLPVENPVAVGDENNGEVAL